VNTNEVELLLADCAGLLTIDKEARDNEWESDRIKAMEKYRAYLFDSQSQLSEGGVMIHYLDTRLSLVTPCGLTVSQVKKRGDSGKRGFKQVTCPECLKKKGMSKEQPK